MEASHDATKTSIAWIEQGSVGRVGECAIGIISVRREKDRKSSGETLVARIAVWPLDRPQRHRNDFLAEHTVKAGDVIPACGHLFRIEGLVDKENWDSIPELAGKRMDRELVILDTSPASLKGVSLQPGSFCVSLGSTGELHGKKIELVELNAKTVNGKETLVGKLEMWPNDDQKPKALEQGLVESVEVIQGEAVRIAGMRHTVLSLNRGTENTSGWIELSAER